MTAAGLLQDQSACGKYLENTVKNLLESLVHLCKVSQDILLAEVPPTFTEKDNEHLLKPPSKCEVFQTLISSNLHAALGTDGLTSYFYKECFHIIGDAFTDVVKNVFSGLQPILSQRTRKMVFGAKPNKANSLKPQDKRRISLLNCDFKTISGIESRRLKRVATHTLSEYQFVEGNDRKIHHGINMARNAIYSVSKNPGNKGCAIADTDYEAAFEFLVMSWVFLVLKQKGLEEKVIQRYTNLYEKNLVIVVVNGIDGKCVNNSRLSLRQGDIPSMYFFAYGIDPLYHT